MAYINGRRVNEMIAVQGGGSEVIANPTLVGNENNLTGLEVDGTKYKVTEVEANPTLLGSENNLAGIEVDGTKYKVSKVVANPTLAGTENDLDGIEIDGTKYKVGGGGKQLYQHFYRCKGNGIAFILNFVCDVNTAATSFTQLKDLTRGLFNNIYSGYVPTTYGEYKINDIKYTITKVRLGRESDTGRDCIDIYYEDLLGSAYGSPRIYIDSAFTMIGGSVALPL